MQIEVKLIGTSSEDAQAIAEAVLTLGRKLPAAESEQTTKEAKKPTPAPEPTPEPAPATKAKAKAKPAPEPEPEQTPKQEDDDVEVTYDDVFKGASLLLTDEAKKGPFKDDLIKCLREHGYTRVLDLKEGTKEALYEAWKIVQKHA